MNKGSVVRYKHHNKMVYTEQLLKGTHRAHCLCYRCGRFKIDDPLACPIANLLFAVCVKCSITTPVFECPDWKPIEEIK